MASEQGVGIGGVMAEVASLTHERSIYVRKKAVLEGKLIDELCARFDVTQEYARASVDLAEKCGVLARVDKYWIKLRLRPR